MKTIEIVSRVNSAVQSLSCGLDDGPSWARETLIGLLAELLRDIENESKQLQEFLGDYTTRSAREHIAEHGRNPRESAE